MAYIFEILGVSSALQLFSHQQTQAQRPAPEGVEYLGSYRCTLDAMLSSVEPLPPKHGWDLDEVVDTVVQFWLTNAERIRYWQQRLQDADDQTVLVARLADQRSLRGEFERLLECR